jgi:hypothetical protein
MIEQLSVEFGIKECCQALGYPAADITSGSNQSHHSRRLKQPDFYALQSRPQELTSIILRRVCRMVRKVADQSTLTFTFSRASRPHSHAVQEAVTND